mmetsp:Transcript_28608/g.43977  ORF Transcript_28608/g.43977 Transcript_28608/m.43977 type:complete len:232 (-) Transcript_28608:1223-1918(-)
MIGSHHVGCSSNDSWCFCSAKLLNFAQFKCYFDQIFERVRHLHFQFGLIGLVLFHVHANSGSRSRGSRKSENDTRTIFHHVSDTLLLRFGSIDRILVHEIIRFLDFVLSSTNCFSFHGVQTRSHVFHHFLGLCLVHTFEVISTVVVASVLLPVSNNDIFHSHECFLLVSIVVSQNRQPRQNGPHSIFLTNVVGTCTKTFFTTNEWSVVLASKHLLGIHEVSEILPPGGSFE